MISVLPMAEVLCPEGHPKAGEHTLVHAFVIRHPDANRLVDSGVGAHPAIEGAYRPSRTPMERALRRVDLGMGDVDALINTHLHFDHCGGNPHFPGVPIWVQRSELEAARKPYYTVPEYQRVAEGGAADLEGQWNAEAYRSSLEQLLLLEPDEAYFSHDPRVWQREA